MPPAPISLVDRAGLDRPRLAKIISKGLEGAERQQVEGDTGGRRERGRSELQGDRQADSLQRVAERDLARNARRLNLDNRPLFGYIL